MQQIDLKTSVALKILSHHAGGKGKERVRAFFDSEDYLKRVLPLIASVEELLMDSWQRFNTPEFLPLPILDFGTPSPLPAPLAHESSPLTPFSSICDSVSTVQMSYGDDGESQGEDDMPTASFDAIAETAGLANDPMPIINTVHPETPVSPLTTEVNPLTLGRPSVEPEPAVATPKQVTVPAPQRAAVMPTTLQFTLPNASVGQAYAHVLLPMNAAPGLVVKEVRIIESIGLSFESSTSRLLGIPTQAGEFQVDILCFRDNCPLDRVSARLIVNPDPKSLWKNLPSDQNDPYWKPDEDHQFISGADGWSLVAGSKRGRSHAQKGTFRDDDFFIFSQEHSGWQIAVVSDGAGSAKFSRHGSAIICKEGGEHLEHALGGEAGSQLIAAVEAWQASLPQDADDQKRLIKKQLYVTLGYAAHFALTRIREECERRSDLGGTVKDYSSTILIGIAKRFPFGIFCGSFSIGDGAIGVMHTDGTPELLCDPDGGDFSGQTRFLSQDTVTQEELLKRLKFSLVPDFAGMYLMTDGISDPYFQTDKGLEMPERWAQLLQDIETEASLTQRVPDSGQRLVSWLDFWSKGEHDDRTLAVIY